jgi:hypothetical protein
VPKDVKQYLRSMRDWPPISALATELMKPISDLLGHRVTDFPVRHLPRSGTVTARLPNGSKLQLWSPRVDFIGNQVYWRGWTGHEPEVLPLFYALAERSIDLGHRCECGPYSLVAS